MMGNKDEFWFCCSNETQFRSFFSFEYIPPRPRLSFQFANRFNTNLIDSLEKL